MPLSIERYLLQCLLEELSEVQKEISKCIRFTPEHKLKDTTNIERVCTEFSEVKAIIDFLGERGIKIASMVTETDLNYVSDLKHWEYSEYLRKEKGVALNKKEYLLQCLLRELASMQRCASDCLVFTPEHRHKSSSNLERLSVSYSEVTAIISLLQDEGFNIEFSESAMMEKLDRLGQFMEISRELGTLDDIENKC